jgi:RHS repeat-associated protein
LVDPEVVVPRDWQIGWAGWAGGQLVHSGYGPFGQAVDDCRYYCYGVYLSMPTNTSFVAGDYAIWYYRAPVNAFVYRAALGSMQHSPFTCSGASCSRSFHGLMNSAFSAWESGVNYVNQYGGVGGNPFSGDWAYAFVSHDYCFGIVPSCSTTSGSEQNYVLFGLQAQNPFGGSVVFTGSNTANTILSTTDVYLGDRRAPLITGTSHSGTGWSNQSVHSVSYSVHDDGLGLYSATMTSGVTASTSDVADCDGDPNLSPCSLDWSAGGHSVLYQMDDGVHTPVLTVSDAVGNTASQSWTERIDTTGPSVVLSGSLAGQAKPKRTPDGSYNLNITASDALSGVKSIQIKVDGKALPVVPNGVICDGCSQLYNWQLNTETIGAGTHQIDVLATDNALNVTDKPLIIDVARAAKADVGPGTLNLLTGNLQIERTDATIDGFGSSLVVSRTYNSRSPGSADPNGAFGPGWISSLPVGGSASDYISLSESPDGSVTITEDGGASETFAYDSGNAKYVAPEGYGDLTLTKVAGAPVTFTLKNTTGTLTTFAIPSGATDSVYRVTDIAETGQGIAGTGNRTTISYETVGGVTRPVEMMAPPPATAPVGTRARTSRPLGAGPVGTRYLDFNYASTTTATGTDAGQSGDFVGRLQNATFWSTDPSTGQVVGTVVATYQYDTNGRLRSATDPRTGLTETYDYNSDQVLSVLTPPGQRPWAMNYASSTGPSDPNLGKLASVSRDSLIAATPTATWSVVYGVPVTGSGAPYQLGTSDVSAWGQTDVAATATAIFPPDKVPASPPTSYGRASIYYLDAYGRAVNTAVPGGRIWRVSVAEYDDHDNTIRELTPANRAAAMAYGSTAADHLARAQQLDVKRTYDATGVELRDELGPLHTVQLPDGTQVQARTHVVTTYDEGSPLLGGPYHLPTSVKVGAQVPGQLFDSDVRTQKTEYDWTLRKPTATVTDPSGLNLRTVTQYDPTFGVVVEKRQPANPNGGDARSTKFIYYAAGTLTTYPECGNKPYWANLVCHELPAAQPTAGLPAIPTKTFTYDKWNNALTEADTAGAYTRTTTYTRDSAGRPRTLSVAASQGTAEPQVTYGYDAQGNQSTASVTESGTTRTVTRQYDALGRLAIYTDADGNTSTTTFDLDGRAQSLDDGKGTASYSYDPVSGDLVGLTDSNAGAYTGSYDADSRLVSSTYPGGLTQQVTYDANGDKSEVKYVKSTSCSSGCTWLDDIVSRTVQGQIVDENSTLSHTVASYDQAGRLSRVRETPAGAGCSVREYSYDADSNRKSVTKHAPLSGGACDTSGIGTTTTYSYDEADRLSSSGYNYDSFGRVLTVPASDALAGTGLTLAYFADDRVRSVTQGQRSRTYDLDPLRRVRVATRVEPAQGNKTTTTTSTEHYSDDSDSPAWTALSANGSTYTRNVVGLDGQLVAIRGADGTTTSTLVDVRGDVIATASLATSATGLTDTDVRDEFGVPESGTAYRFGYKGAARRSTELATDGLIAMGQRVYLPTIGRFLQTDPLPGGSCNAYDYVCQDPLNQSDLDGRLGVTLYSAHWKVPTARKIGNYLLLAAQAAAGAPSPPIKGIPAIIVDLVKELAAAELENLGTEIVVKAGFADADNIAMTKSDRKRHGMYGISFKIVARLGFPPVATRVHIDRGRRYNYKLPKRHPIG